MSMSVINPIRPMEIHKTNGKKKRKKKKGRAYAHAMHVYNIISSVRIYMNVWVGVTRDVIDTM